MALPIAYGGGGGQPPNIDITNPTGTVEGDSTIIFDIAGRETANAIFCYLDGNPSNGQPYIGATTINDFFGQIGLNVGPHLINCEARNDYGTSMADGPYIVKAAPTAEEIPEFPTAALPVIIAAGGYLALRRMKNKE